MAKRTRHAEFHENISYFVERRQRSFSGELCFSCMSSVFIEFTGKTLLGTWWGAIGFLGGPFFIVSNMFQYIKNCICFAVAAVADLFAHVTTKR